LPSRVTFRRAFVSFSSVGSRIFSSLAPLSMTTVFGVVTP